MAEFIAIEAFNYIETRKKCGPCSLQPQCTSAAFRGLIIHQNEVPLRCVNCLVILILVIDTIVSSSSSPFLRGCRTSILGEDQKRLLREQQVEKDSTAAQR